MQHYRNHKTPASFRPGVITTLLVLLFPLTTQAETADTEARLMALQKQMQALSQELSAVRQELALSKASSVTSTSPAIVPEKTKNDDNVVHATFKDGLVFDDASGNWKLQINGRVQADYRNYEGSDWKNDSFSIRRARFGGTFTFLKDYAVRVEGEYANDNTGAKATTALTYAYLDINWWKQAKIRIGQFKPWFGLERTYSTNFTDFTELSLATNNGAIFNSTYDRGVMIFGDPLPWLNYDAYVINGAGQNNDEMIDNTKDVGGRINANFAKLANIDNAVIHVGASASRGTVSYTPTTATGISQGTEANGVQFFNVTGVQNKDADRKRWGLETALAYGPLKLQSEYINTNLDGIKAGAPDAGAYDNDIKAWYANLNWMITGESYADSYKSGVFGRTKPKNNMTMGKDGWGAWELGLRYSRFDASDFRSMLTSTAYTAKADSWTGGVKWILNPNARILLNYIQTEFDTPIVLNGKRDDQEKSVVMRAQFDF